MLTLARDIEQSGTIFLSWQFSLLLWIFFRLGIFLVLVKLSMDRRAMLGQTRYFS